MAKGWHVIATRRTAETVQAIDELFASIEEGALHVLLPLRESDVVAIAEGHGLNSEAFMGFVDQQALPAQVRFTGLSHVYAR